MTSIAAKIYSLTGFNYEKIEARCEEYAARDGVRPGDVTHTIIKAGMIAANAAGFQSLDLKSEDIPALCYLACAYNVGTIVSLFLDQLKSNSMMVHVRNGEIMLVDGADVFEIGRETRGK
jgi:hypothetical protein